MSFYYIHSIKYTIYNVIVALINFICIKIHTRLFYIVSLISVSAVVLYTIGDLLVCTLKYK